MIPKATIKIENPIAVTTNSSNKTKARAFLRYLRTVPAQRIFAQNGYRPVVKQAQRGFVFPVRPKLSSRSSTSAAGRLVDKRFFDPKTGIVTKIQKSKGGD